MNLKNGEQFTKANHPNGNEKAKYSVEGIRGRLITKKIGRSFKILISESMSNEAIAI